MNQEFLTFELNRQTIFYLAAYAQDAAIKAAMAKALITTTGTETLKLTIHEAQVAVMYEALLNVPCGIGAMHNNELQALIIPYLESHPRMAGLIAELNARNQAAHEQVLLSGEKELYRIIQLLQLN